MNLLRTLERILFPCSLLLLLSLNVHAGEGAAATLATSPEELRAAVERTLGNPVLASLRGMQDALREMPRRSTRLTSLATLALPGGSIFNTLLACGQGVKNGLSRNGSPLSTLGYSASYCAASAVPVLPGFDLLPITRGSIQMARLHSGRSDAAKAPILPGAPPAPSVRSQQAPAAQ